MKRHSCLALLVFLSAISQGYSSCACQNDDDCYNPVCVFNRYSNSGFCGAGPNGPTGGCPCQSHYDCQNMKCFIDLYSGSGTCSSGPSAPTSRPPTTAPVPPPSGNHCCLKPRSIPTKCEVDILIDLLNHAIISSNFSSTAQWLRLSFHDAGTFNSKVPEGGANGCLMTDPNFPNQPENAFLHIPIAALLAVKNAWQAHPMTCLVVSHADIIQFAGRFSALRQVPPTGIDPVKRDDLYRFEWGRIDETKCDITWVEHLPGFRLGTQPPTDIPLRCLMAGAEIKNKMMDLNGFTAEESTALIGAHTIGLTRQSFGTNLSDPWVLNGADHATPDGPIFDNAFHDFLENGIVADTAAAFGSNPLPSVDPFDIVFDDWFKDVDDGLNHLDTDVVLAFPTQDPNIHPDFHAFTAIFAADNDQFLGVFFKALDKMSRLGVFVPLFPATNCTDCDGDGIDTLPPDVIKEFDNDLFHSKIEAEEQLLVQLQSDEIAQAIEERTKPVFGSLSNEEVVAKDGGPTKSDMSSP